MPKLQRIAILIALGASAWAQTPDPQPYGGIICLACKPSEAASQPATPVRKTILGQRIAAFEPWIAHIAGQKAFILQTPRSTLVAAVEGSPVDALADGEAAYLRSVFPSLGAAMPATLDAHQEAHLLAWRLLQVEKDVHDLLDLDQTGRVKPESGPYGPLASEHVEIFVISKPEGEKALALFLGEGGNEPLPTWGRMLSSGPTAVVRMPSLKDTGARAQFVFASVVQLASGLSRAGSGLQAWLQVGLAHLMADRHALPNHPTYILPLSGGAKQPKDWNAAVADLVTAGKAGDLAALAETPLTAISYRSEIQSWSMVRWLIEKDAKKFAQLVRHILHSSPTEAAPKTLVAAVRKAYDHDLVTLLEEWKAAVQKSRASTK